ncbi:MAG: insulinase family protein, partial [Gammaproteobacteria bacterium]|nr:insulinase family protein [Gammaproteobacteria bacterium]
STWFKPDNATLIVAGDIRLDELKRKLNKLFSDWQPGTVPAKQLAVDAPENVSTIYVVDRTEAEQSVIFAGQLLPPRANPDELALQAMNNILGGLSSSRINMNLREDKGWSYGAYSMIVGARGQRPLLIYAPVQTDKTRESIEQIKMEMLGIETDQPPTSDELDIVKNSKTLSLPGRWETNMNLVGALEEIVRYGLPEDYWSTYAANLNGLSLQATQQAARNYVQPDKVIWVVVGDRQKIEPALRELGFEAIRFIDADGQPVIDEQ